MPPMSISANYAHTTDSLPLYEGGAAGLRDVPAHDHPTITPFITASGRPTAAVLVCPGGGYQRVAAHEAAPVAHWLNTLGISAFVLRYRVAPYAHPAPLDDARRAMQLIRERAGQWNIRPDRAGILGFSAGGHLAATLATFPGVPAPERPDVLMLGYPVISFGEWAHEGSMTRLLGDPTPPEDRRAGLSAERNVSPQSPPTFLWHTADDPAVNVANSLEFAAACNRAGVPFALHVFASGRHGLGLADELPDVHRWTTLCADFLAAQDFRPESP